MKLRKPRIPSQPCNTSVVVCMQTMPLGSFATVLEPANEASLRSASGGANALPEELDWWAAPTAWLVLFAMSHQHPERASLLRFST
jgi:hypothetical protein